MPTRTLLVMGALLLTSPVAGSGRSPETSLAPDLRNRALAMDAPRVHGVIEVVDATSGSIDASVTLLRPLGGNRWLGSISREVAASGRLPAGVLRARSLLPSEKMDPALRERPEGDRVRVRVKVFRDADLAGVERLLGAIGAAPTSRNPKLGYLESDLDPGRLPEVAAWDAVRWIESAAREYQTAANDMRVDAGVNGAQAMGVDGSGVTLGVWDNGIADTSHPDLTGRIAAGEVGLSVDGHTTHVSGIAIGDGTNSQNQGGGGLQWRGVALDASIVSYDVPDFLAEIDSAIAAHDVDLTSNSWHWTVNGQNCSRYGNYADDAAELDEIVRGAYGKPIPIVFAAGNERDDNDCGFTPPTGYGTIPTPSTAKNIITVGAHQSDQGYMTPFSGWGPTDDGRMKPEISAPGCQVFGDLGITSTDVGGTYSTRCGTSMSTPVISGGIAMIFEDWRARFPGDPRPATTKALLGGFARDRANPGPDYKYGLGAVNVERTLLELRTGTTIEDAVADGGLDLWTFHVPAGTDTLAVTMAWDDPAGAELADTTLVNDLDLELVAPTAGTYLAFVLDPQNPSADATTGANRLDNVEQVRVLGPEAGWWTARVRGFDVSQGPQDYSLVGWDARPPADPASLAAVASSDSSIELTWIRPGDEDRAGTMVVRAFAPVSWTPADGETYPVGAEVAPGVFVVADDDVDHSGAPLTDVPLISGLTYHYAAFSRDEVPNWSAGVAAQAQTSGSAVEAPVIAAGPAGFRWAREGANPSSGPSAFRFELPRSATISIDVYDATGRHVATLLQGRRDAGSHRVEWDGRDASRRDVASGVYFVRFRTAEFAATEKVLRVR